MRLDPSLVLRARARRARLDRSATSPEGVAHAVVALHGTDPATIHLSSWARQPPEPLADVAGRLRAAVEERSIVRVMAMRRTVHLVPRSLAAAAIGLATARLAGPMRKLALGLLASAGAAAPGEEQLTWARLREEVLGALGDADLDAAALQELVPDLGRRISLSEGKAYAGTAPLSRYVLEALCVEGSVVRARAVGSWRSPRNTWARTDRWLPGLAPAAPADAYRDLARAWIDAFGPGTLADLAWWAGIPKRDAAAAVAALGDEVVQVEVAGWPGERLVTRSWLDALDGAAGHAPAFLPALDPSIMALEDRGPVMDPAWKPLLFDRNGNAGPTIWVDGRVVGGWVCKKGGGIATRILADGVDASAVERAARQLADSLGDEAVMPRFPTPLSKELAG